nr:helix-turn-helix transcriptional regulator [uncultured Clostridium sp.]
MSENIYERYCRLRDLAGYKDSDVANGAGITKSTFSDWKNGRYVPKQAKLQKIADFLKVDYQYLLNGEMVLVESESDSERNVRQQQRLLEYARRLLDLGIDPDALEALIDTIEKMQKKD